ncbi:MULTISPECIES: hypothetical protein [Erythrobacter]|jgi:hypothetical protein|uniref:hypothetical protein n=1 Tax=Erythrobacter TaxID=1041 RepID=UPI0013B4080E|nr:MULTISPECIES: hypothetical protein [Erythrobacter]MCF8883875.1 hypothetical protein [Erythrobacter sp. SN021]|tara:strand:+ start:590 stop:763 length:174 start_codon:yes stop_codon:yes gene_type:complete
MLDTSHRTAYNEDQEAILRDERYRQEYRAPLSRAGRVAGLSYRALICDSDGAAPLIA